MCPVLGETGDSVLGSPDTVGLVILLLIKLTTPGDIVEPAFSVGNTSTSSWD